MKENLFSWCMLFSGNLFMKQLNRESEEEFKKIWLSQAQAFTLMIIKEKKIISNIELSFLLAIDTSTSTRVVKNLEKHWYIQKSKKSKNVEIILTNKWEEKINQIIKSWKDIYNSYNLKYWKSFCEGITKQLNTQINNENS